MKASQPGLQTKPTRLPGQPELHDEVLLIKTKQSKNQFSMWVAMTLDGFEMGWPSLGLEKQMKELFC